MKKAETLVPIVSLFTLSAIGFFLYGAAVGKYEIWPYQTLSEMKEVAVSLLTTGGVHPANRLFPRPAGASGELYVAHAPERVQPGYRAIMGYDAEWGGYSIRLLDASGTQVHKWELDYLAYDPDGPSNQSDMPHGMYVMPDASVIVTFDLGDVMVRLDSCSEPMWIQEGNYHHSIDRGLGGTFWTWLSDGNHNSPMQYMVNFDPDSGETIRSIGLVEDFVERSPEMSIRLGVPLDYDIASARKHIGPNTDLFHPNDLEVLPEELAPAFPEFRVGDLLISLKKIHMIALVDPGTLEIKWALQGPWRFQHDPDFNPNGQITVYNNNSGRGRTSITAVNPSTREVHEPFSSGGVKYYSESMGKHQILPHGGVLIVVPAEGRVLELDRDGKLVAEFNNIYGDKLNFTVEHALWLPETYFERSPNCE
jgi:hypothetical protein